MSLYQIIGAIVIIGGILIGIGKLIYTVNMNKKDVDMFRLAIPKIEVLEEKIKGVDILQETLAKLQQTVSTMNSTVSKIDGCLETFMKFYNKGDKQ